MSYLRADRADAYCLFSAAKPVNALTLRAGVLSDSSSVSAYTSCSNYEDGDCRASVDQIVTRFLDGECRLPDETPSNHYIEYK